MKEFNIDCFALNHTSIYISFFFTANEYLLNFKIKPYKMLKIEYSVL